MRKIIICINLILIFVVGAFAQANEKISLVIKYSPKSNKFGLQRFVKLEFQNGKLISKKILFTIDEAKNGGIHWFHLDRYILSTTETINGWRPEDDLAFDLKTEKFVDKKTIPKREKIDYENEEIKSPDGKKGIKAQGLREGADKLVIHIENQKDLIINEKFEATVKSISSALPYLPLIWIDNERILTQKKNGSLVIVTLDGKVTPFLEIPCTSDDFPSFRTTKAGKLIYECSSTEFQIDLENKTFEKINNDLDYDFATNYVDGKQWFYYKNKEIGGVGLDMKTTEGYLATTYGKEGKYNMFDAGEMNIINVWSKYTEKWQTFNFNGSHIGIMGWFKR